MCQADERAVSQLFALSFLYHRSSLFLSPCLALSLFHTLSFFSPTLTLLHPLTHSPTHTHTFASLHLRLLYTGQVCQLG